MSPKIVCADLQDEGHMFYLIDENLDLILQAVGSLYYFLVRRGTLMTSPVTYVDVPRGKWLTERDLLAHIRKGHGAQKTQRMELKLKEPDRLPKTVSEQDFQEFVECIH